MTAQRPHTALTPWVVLRLCLLWLATWAAMAVAPQASLEAPVRHVQQAAQLADAWALASEPRWGAAVGQLRSGRVESKTAFVATKSGPPQPPKAWHWAQPIGWLFQIHGPWVGYACAQPAYFTDIFHLLQPRAPPRAWTFTGTCF